MRTDDDRRIPIPAQRCFAGGRFRLNIDALTRLAIKPHQPAVLPFGIDDVWILGINCCKEAITAHGHKPIGIGDAVGAGGTRGTTQCVVVLRAAIDVVERRAFIHRHTVELCHRQVRLVMPVCTAIPGFINAAIVAVDQMIGVGGVNPQRMIINVLVFFTETLPGFSAVFSHVIEGIHRVHPIRVFRIGYQLLVILRTAGHIVSHPVPAFTAIIRTIYPTFFRIRCFNNGVNHIWVSRRHR